MSFFLIKKTGIHNTRMSAVTTRELRIEREIDDHDRIEFLVLGIPVLCVQNFPTTEPSDSCHNIATTTPRHRIKGEGDFRTLYLGPEPRPRPTPPRLPYPP